MPTYSISYPQRSTHHRSPLRRIRVLLVDDHAMVRQGLRNHLSRYADIELVGEAADGQEAVALADQLSPDVVVMDINMPRMNGIEATGSILRKHPSVHIVGLSFERGTKNREALLKAGARLVLDKGIAHEQLLHAIYHAVDKRRGRFSPRGGGDSLGRRVPELSDLPPLL